MPPLAEEDGSPPLAEDDVAQDPAYPTVEELQNAMENAFWRSFPREERARREAYIKIDLPLHLHLQ